VRIQLKLASNWYAKKSGSVALAERWQDGFLELLESLSINPERFGLAHESDFFDDEVRELLYGSGRRKTHRALFTINGRRVEILSVRHIAQRDITPVVL
jgi:hypothetical protein